MMTTNTSKAGLESLIVKAMTGLTGDGRTPAGGVGTRPTPYGGTGWLLGDTAAYDREPLEKLFELGRCTAHFAVDDHEISFCTHLIADVVTGKLDVREAAARLPDESDELEPLDEADALAHAEENTAGDLNAAPEEAQA